MGVWAYDTWRELNAECFDKKLVLAPIQFGLIPHGHALAWTQNDNNLIMLHPSLLRPTSDDPWELAEQAGFYKGTIGNFDRRRYTRDVLLHEMLHQAVHQSGIHVGENESHMNPEWVAGIVRISPIIGITCKAQRPRRRRVNKKNVWWVPDGFLTRKQLSQWPYSARPAEFYAKTYTP